MIRAIAMIEAWSGTTPASFRILACPADREMEGGVFAAPREVGTRRIGEYVVVKFTPDDQFAYECKEALLPQESAESRVARGLHPEPGPHCVECGKRLTETEAAAQRPDYDEVCAACGGPSPQEGVQPEDTLLAKDDRAKRHIAPVSKLEDIFAGLLELTASELAYLRHALAELYMRGGWCPKGENRRDFTNRVSEKLGTLKLDRMVTPDGSRLVSVEEHAAIVATS